MGAYSQAEIDYIKANIVGTPYKKLAEQLNKTFNTDRSYQSVKRFCNKNLKLSNYVNKWSDDEKLYLINNCNNKSYSELAKEVSKVIGVNRTANQVMNECYFLGVKNNRDTRYKKGHKVWNEKPILHERKGSNGKTYLKVSNDRSRTRSNSHNSDKNYVIKHNYIWEQAYGKIPDDCVVIFADGNKDNFDLDNLICIPISVKQMMNANGWQFLNNELLRKIAIRSCYINYVLKED